MVLRPEHTIGRGNADLVLPDLRVSSQHASLRWVGTVWVLRDLGSRNGTWVDGARLPAGINQPILAHSRFAVGHPDLAWELEDASAPTAFATCGPDAATAGPDGLLRLPAEGPPEVILAWDAAAGQWIGEDLQTGEVREIGAAAEWVAGGRTWRLWLPQEIPGTIDLTTGGRWLRSVALHFDVPHNWENIEVTVIHGDERISLGTHACHFALFVLAQHRAACRGEGSGAEGGWMPVEETLRKLRYTSARFNLDVYRLRQLCAAAGILDAPAIIERRVPTREVRTGCADLRFTFR